MEPNPSVKIYTANPQENSKQSTRVNISKITFPLVLTLPCGFLAPPPWQIISDYNIVYE